VRNQPKGPLVFISRSDAGMVQRLFEQEVPEVQDGLVVIQAIARDPGSRTKMAVISNDSGIDPVGACVGMRGARVQAVVNELHGEKIDIIEWTPDTVSFVVNALAPAEIERVLVDEDSNTIEVAVAEDQLAIAIGRRGQNVRLASELTGWKIEIMTAGEERKKRVEEFDAARQVFEECLDIDEGFATLLCNEGFLSLENLAYCSQEELIAIEGLDEDTAHELQNRARNYLLQQELGRPEAAEIEDSLLALEGVSRELAAELAIRGIGTAEALADAAVDDLTGIEHASHEQLEALIIAAREACGWFD